MIILGVGVFLFFLSVFMFTPMFIYYFVDVGGNYLELASIISLASLISTLIHPYIGYISDKKGAKKSIIIGYIIIIVSLFLNGLCIHTWQLIIIYIIFQIGIGIVTAGMFGLISRIKIRDDRSYIPYYRTVQGVGVIIGPIIGGLILKISISLNSICASFIAFISLILFIKAIKNYYNPPINESLPKDKINGFFAAFKTVVMNKGFLIICIIFLILEFAFDITLYNNMMFGEYIKADPMLIGLSFSAYFFTFTLFQVPINNYLKKITRFKAIFFMAICSFISSCFFIFNFDYEMIIIGMIFMGLTVGSLFTYCTVLVSEIAPEDKKGIYLGIFNLIMPLTDVASPILVSLLFNIRSRLSYYTSSVMLLLIVIIVLFSHKDLKDK